MASDRCLLSVWNIHLGSGLPLFSALTVPTHNKVDCASQELSCAIYLLFGTPSKQEACLYVIWEFNAVTGELSGQYMHENSVNSGATMKSMYAYLPLKMFKNII